MNPWGKWKRSKKCCLPGDYKSACIAYVEEMKGKTALLTPKALSIGKAIQKRF